MLVKFASTVVRPQGHLGMMLLLLRRITFFAATGVIILHLGETVQGLSVHNDLSARKATAHQIQKHSRSLQMANEEDNEGDMKILSPPRRRVVVVGGAGFIGSHVVDRLMGQGHQVVVVDNIVTGSMKNVEQWMGHPNFNLIAYDFTGPLSLQADQMYYLACPVDGVKKGDHGSSGIVSTLQLDEEKPTRILWACGDDATDALKSQVGVDLRVARFADIIGPRMQIAEGGIVADLVVQALKGRDMKVHGDKTTLSSLLYVDDLVDGLIALMESDASMPVTFADPKHRSMKEVAELIRALASSKSLIRHLPTQDEDQSLAAKRLPSTAQKVLKWEPKTDLKEGLQHTISYFERVLDEQAKAADVPVVGGYSTEVRQLAAVAARVAQAREAAGHYKAAMRLPG